MSSKGLCPLLEVKYGIREKCMKKKNKWSTFILLLFFFIGLSVMLYPALSSYWNSRTQSAAITDYEKMLESMPRENWDEYFKEADEYNAALAELDLPLVEYGRIEGYDDVLNVSGNGMMGYVSIEKIGVELPLYHGTSESVLAAAAGHVEGTSLPVGGVSTHAVVSAHRGLPTATLFTHLDRMEIGDTFEFTFLDRTFTYQVDMIKTVLPTDTSDITIVKGEEYCTLLTCTPYGINTHRLLVRGRILDATREKNIYVRSDALLVDSLIVTPVVALPMLFVLMMIVLFKPAKKENTGGEIK